MAMVGVCLQGCDAQIEPQGMVPCETRTSAVVVELNGTEEIQENTAMEVVSESAGRVSFGGGGGVFLAIDYPALEDAEIFGVGHPVTVATSYFTGIPGLAYVAIEDASGLVLEGGDVAERFPAFKRIAFQAGSGDACLTPSQTMVVPGQVAFAFDESFEIGIGERKDFLFGTNSMTAFVADAGVYECEDSSADCTGTRASALAIRTRTPAN
jgi:hypothetical protein